MISNDLTKKFVLEMLRKELSPELYYHSYNHTIDVCTSALQLAKMENISGKDLVLLETAALFHDTGFVLGYSDHEEKSVAIAKENLPKFGYNTEDIEEICQMIRSTKLPQTPTNIKEKILCDADLDYLGRDDFFMIANRLLCEWNANGLPTSLKKWYSIQVDFLSKNDFFTDSARALRMKKKNENLTQIMELFS